MTFGDYYKKSSNYLQTIYNKNSKNILNRLSKSPEQQKCNELADFYNAIMYQKESENQIINAEAQRYRNNIANIISKIYLEQSDKYLDPNTILSTTGKYSYIKPKDIGKIIRDTYESLKHSEYIEKQTLLNRLDKMQQWLTANQNIDTKEINNYRDKIQQLIEQINQFLNENELNDKIEFKNNAGLKEQINKLDEEYRKLSVAPITTNFTKTDIGNIFEMIGTLMNYDIEEVEDMYANQQTEQLKEQLLKQGQEAIKSAFKNGLSISYKDIEIKGPKETITDKKGKITGYKTQVVDPDTGDTISFEYNNNFNPDNIGKQGKMDIKFDHTIGSSKAKQLLGKYRISAKNWINTDETHNFGHSQLLYSLLRTINKNDTEYLAFYYGDLQNQNQLQIADGLLKIAVAADLLMGYSQKNNYVDTLVINNRGAQRVEVYSLKNIFEKLCNNAANKLQLDNIDFDTLHSKFQAFSRIANKGKKYKSKEYYRLAMSLMNGITTSVRYIDLVQGEYIVPSA